MKKDLSKYKMFQAEQIEWDVCEGYSHAYYANGLFVLRYFQYGSGFALRGEGVFFPKGLELEVLKDFIKLYEQEEF